MNQDGYCYPFSIQFRTVLGGFSVLTDPAPLARLEIHKYYIQLLTLLPTPRPIIFISATPVWILDGVEICKIQRACKLTLRTLHVDITCMPVNTHQFHPADRTFEIAQRQRCGFLLRGKDFRPLFRRRHIKTPIKSYFFHFNKNLCLFQWLSRSFPISIYRNKVIITFPFKFVNGIFHSLKFVYNMFL